MTYVQTPRTTPTRYAHRVGYDRPTAHQILDEALVCHLGLVVDGAPRVLPTLVARLGETIYLHGSTGSGPVLALGPDDQICVGVTLLDGVVFTRAQFDHSANYRSLVAYGTPRRVTDPAELAAVFDAFVDKAGRVGGNQPDVPPRSRETRPPTPKELAATAVLALDLTEVSVKVRAGGPSEEPEDQHLPHWAGVVPLRTVADRPLPGPDVRVPVPGHLRPAGSPWQRPVELVGRHVRLEPLDLCHAAELFAALDDEEVHRYVPHPRPTGPADLAGLITAWLDQAHRGARVCWVQRDPTTGQVIGTTSYLAADEANRMVHIGGTLLSRRYWRTAVNTETKLLLMGRAFDELGAVRVEWQTDIRNPRSQAAIERLGARRDGVLRRHRLRPDGTWRDTVLYSMTDDEWPAARDRLVDRLNRGS